MPFSQYSQTAVSTQMPNEGRVVGPRPQAELPVLEQVQQLQQQSARQAKRNFNQAALNTARGISVDPAHVLACIESTGKTFDDFRAKVARYQHGIELIADITRLEPIAANVSQASLDMTAESKRWEQETKLHYERYNALEAEFRRASSARSSIEQKRQELKELASPDALSCYNAAKEFERDLTRGIGERQRLREELREELKRQTQPLQTLDEVASRHQLFDPNSNTYVVNETTEAWNQFASALSDHRRIEQRLAEAELYIAESEPLLAQAVERTRLAEQALWTVEAI